MAHAGCLTDAAIAAMAEGRAGSAAAPGVAHLADCDDCRLRLAGTLRVLRDVEVAEELRALRAWPSRRRAWTVGAGLAAAAAIVFLLAGSFNRAERPGAADANLHRDALTGTPGPRLLSPTVAAVGDSVRWTPVTSSDLYRVRIWTTDGTVVWTADTRDTSAALPPVLVPGTQYLWDVKARTGWDRWAPSELIPLTVRERPAR